MRNADFMGSRKEFTVYLFIFIKIFKMKKLILACLFVGIFASGQSYGVKAKNIDAVDKSVLKNYKVENDQFSGASFITPKVSMTSKYAYLSIKDDLLNIRLVMEYNGNRWLYLQNVIIKYGDKKIEYPAGSIKTDTGSDYLLETSDVKCSPEMIAALKEAISEEKVLVRLEGSGSVFDFEMSEKTKKSIRLAIEMYEKLKI